MSSSVDNRVVSMGFDNRNFEQNVSQSLNTIDKLKRALRFEGIANGFSEIENSANRVNMSGIAYAADDISSRFSALEIVAITALSNITNKAVDAGERLVKSLSIDQVSSGWDKYTQKTASVQTIMNATGLSIKEVSERLNKLMWFSDETSYSFSDMSSSLGQLTASGGDIDKVIPMIMGIANATAFAGKGTSEFSRAIYNLNQSYSSGALKYMDWRSLELAGVASEQLKQIFIDTGISLGRLTNEAKTAKGSLVDIGSFGSTLSENWADVEVMEKAFGYFSEMTEKAYEMVNRGEVETASEAYEKLADTYDTVSLRAAKSAQEAKSFIEAIDATKDAVSSKWMTTFELIFGDKEEATKLWTQLSEDLWEIFAKSGDERNDFLSVWKDLGGRDALVEAFENIMLRLKSAINIFGDAFSEVFGNLKIAELFSWTTKFRDFVHVLEFGEKGFLQQYAAADKFKRSLKGVFAIADIVKKVIFEIGKAVIPNVFENGSNFLGKILDVTAAIGDYFVKVDEGIKTSGILKTSIDNISSAFGWLKEKLSPIKELFDKILNGITDSFSNFTFLDDISVAITNLWDIVKKIAQPFISIVDNIFGKIAEYVHDSSFSDFFHLWLSVLTSKKAFEGITGFKKFIEQLNSAKDKVSGISDILDQTLDAFKEWQNQLKAKTLLGIAGAIGLVAVSLTVLGTIPGDKLLGAFAALAGVSVILNTLLKSLDGIGGKKLGKTVAALIGISSAMLLVSLAAKSLSGIDGFDLAVSMAGIAAIAVIMVSVAEILSSNSKKIISGTSGLISFSAALLIMSVSVKSLAEIDAASLAKGVVGVSVLTALSSAFAKTSFSKRAISAGAGLVLLSSALLILTKVVDSLGSMNISKCAQGVAAITILITALTLFTRLSNGSGMLSVGIAMMFVASAIKTLSNTVEKLGSLSIGSLAKGLISVSLALTILGVALRLISYKADPIRLIAASIGVSILAGAVGNLTNSLSKMSKIPATSIAKALVALGSSVVMLGVAGAAFATLVKVFGVSFFTGALALTALSVSMTLMAFSLKSLENCDLPSVAASLLLLAGALAAFAFVSTLLAPAAVPMLVMAGVIIAFSAAAWLLATAIEKVSGLFEDFAIDLTGVSDLAKKAGDSVKSAFKSASDGLSQYSMYAQNGIDPYTEGLLAMGDAAEKASNSAVNANDQIKEQLLEREQFRDIGKQNMDAFAEGLSEGNLSSSDSIISSMKLDEDGLAALNELGNSYGIDLTKYMADGIADGSSVDINAISSLIGTSGDTESMLGVIGESMPEWSNIGINIDDGLASGISQGKDSPISAVRSLIQEVIAAGKEEADIHSPSRVFEAMGVFCDKGFGLGISNGANYAIEPVSNLMRNAIEKAEAMIQNRDIDQPVIRPVLDLSNVESGAKNINGILGTGRTLQLARAGISSGSYRQNLYSNSNGYSGGNNVYFTFHGYSVNDGKTIAKLVNRELGGLVR